MVTLRFSVSDVDFDAVIQALAGHLAGPVILAARAMPDSAKEELVVRYINANAAQIEQWIENALFSKGMRMKITGAQAEMAEQK